MLPRLKYHCLILKGLLDYRLLQYKYGQTYPFSRLIINVGLYKPSTFLPQHILLAATLSGKGPIIAYQSHGKRQRRTVMAKSVLVKD